MQYIVIEIDTNGASEACGPFTDNLSAMKWVQNAQIKLPYNEYHIMELNFPFQLCDA